jgi:hypothetical protein
VLRPKTVKDPPPSVNVAVFVKIEPAAMLVMSSQLEPELRLINTPTDVLATTFEFPLSIAVPEKLTAA